MPTSKICLPDINFWLALVTDRHVFHARALDLFGSAANESYSFCRVTQMGLLRLVTNPKVLGEDTVSQIDAWRLYEQLVRDRRVLFTPDDQQLGPTWKQYSVGPLGGRKLWTDAYLAAFAAVRDWRIVTFDRDFLRLGPLGPEVVVLAE